MSTESIEWGREEDLSVAKLTRVELQALRESLTSDYKNISIRLREGEYQYDLAKTIATFHLESSFPDVKNIISRLYGEEKTTDIQFVRKIQTILKKMEKSNIVKILPKKTPWELQRYVLLSFRFQDNERNLVNLVTDEQRDQLQRQLEAVISEQQEPSAISLHNLKVAFLMLVILFSYIVIVWEISQAILDLSILITALSAATAFSLLLGKTLARK
ncbi:MAG: hypothetical protein QHH24_06805 [Candidatus Bathyarchaeota archaeon]|nr:hypothetical protein [Candidatus Bathyarchaeota archaeon]